MLEWLKLFKMPISQMQKLLFLFWCLITLELCAQPSDTSTAAATLDSTVILNNDWYFCPVQNYQPEVDIAVLDCKPINLPNGWETIIPDYNGYGLLYTYFNLPKHVSEKTLGFYVDTIRDADKTFINGQLIGEMGDFPPQFDKAVLYSRLYPIPSQLLKTDQPNLLTMWVYNDARPGGLTQSLPVIDTHLRLLNNLYRENLQSFAFVLVLGMFSLLHFIYYLFHRQSPENLYYGLFLLGWSAYIYTISNLPANLDISYSLLFRINVSLFFYIFGFFPIFLYLFFQQKIPMVLKIIMGVSLALIPFCFLLPEPALVYYPLEFVEILTIPALIIIYHLLFKAIKAKLAYAKMMSSVIIIYTLLGAFDIYADFAKLKAIKDIKLLGPWGLVILSLVLTLIMAHKNFVYYKDATIDKLTKALRFSEFLTRLELEIFRAGREKKPLVLIMVDLNDFKKINDQYGHIQGDKVLVAVSECLRGHLRHFDLLGRYGGDEFCVAAILDNNDEIRSFVQRLHQNVNDLTFVSKGIEHPVSATFGAVTKYPSVDQDNKTLIESADNLLITAKSSAKGTILW